jgi:CO dehydrogenase nickel-insertion accessory protein CooC1
MVLGKMGSEGAGAGCDGPIAKIGRDLRVRSDTDPPVTLLDFKAGFEDTARGVITGLDWAIMVADPTGASIRMAAEMKAIVRQLAAGARPATDHLGDPALVELANRLYRDCAIRGVSFILNKVDSDETERTLRGELDKREVTPAGVLPYDAAVSRAWLLETPLSGARTMDARRIADRLEAAVGDSRQPARHASD